MTKLDLAEPPIWWGQALNPMVPWCRRLEEVGALSLRLKLGLAQEFVVVGSWCALKSVVAELWGFFPI
jgi:hypothetical protein